jgi:LPPG:FO 2-phospho-L-lactate transferase
VRLLPMTDDQVETHVVVDVPGSEDERRAIHFQEWWIRYHAELPAHSIVPIGADEAKPAPGVLEAIAGADAVLFAPSNPVVSVGTVLSIPGVREAVRTTSAGVVGISPIIGDAPVRGMADACLAAIGVETSAEAVGRHYGSRKADGVLDGWLIAPEDKAVVDGVTVRNVPLLMSDVDATAAMVRAALDLAGVSLG